MNMKIGITNIVDPSSPLRINLDEIALCGFDSIDFQEFVKPNSWLYQCSDQELEEYCLDLKNKAKAKGLLIHQLHSLWASPMNEYDQEDVLFSKTIHYYIRSIQAASILETKYVVLHHKHPFMESEMKNHQNEVRDITIRFLKALLPYAEKYDVILCLENLPFDMYCVQFEDTLRIIQEIDSPYLKMCLDIGHFNMFNNGYSLKEAIQKAAPYLKVLHIHDNNGLADKHLFPFLGTVPFQELVDGLNAIHFDGVFSLETKSKKKNPISRICENKKLLSITKDIVNGCNESKDISILWIGDSSLIEVIDFLPQLMQDIGKNCHIEGLRCLTKQVLSFLIENNFQFDHVVYDQNNWQTPDKQSAKALIASSNWE